MVAEKEALFGQSQDAGDGGNCEMLRAERALRRAAEEKLRMAEKKLAAVEERLRAIERFSRVFMSSAAAVAIAELADGRYLDVNDAFSLVFGYAREEVVGRTAGELGLWPSAAERAAFVAAVIEAGMIRGREIVLRAKSGEMRTLLCSAGIAALGEKEVIVTTFCDITAQIAREAALREAEARQRELAARRIRDLEKQFERAFNLSPTAMSIRRLADFTYAAVNDAWLKVTGFEREEVLGRTSAQIGHHINHEEIEQFVAALAKGQLPENIKAEFRTKAGEKKVGLLSGGLILYGGEPCLILATADVTELKAAEELAWRRERDFRTLVENFPDAVARIDGNLCLAYINPAFEKILGIEAGRAAGLPLKLACPPFSQDWLDKCRMVLEKGQPLEFEADAALAHAMGGHSYLCRIVPEYDDQGTVESVMAIIRDITGQRQLEKEISRLDRLAVVGEMAASIGHEVRNPMTTVRGFLQLFQKKPEFASYDGHLQLMIEELDRANSIITEFLSLARNKAVVKIPSDLNDIIYTMFPLLYTDALRAGHEIVLELGQIPLLDLDRQEIRQCILNLVRNSLEAMTDKGKVTIRTYFEGGRTFLAIADQGPGIPLEHRDKIGTPFFTTKDTGTGLGLAVCYSIAARHNAELSWRTGSGGTTFFLSFKAPD